ncbi:type II toxin-antitoxin system VapC family toxin [Accumulibacter sp.]|uniref:type II toxin-antitoxin system VapC family toxin n=1 Tax=Accumulibacter sp. TaxID=2053492 RepID=UPI0025E8392F|nr:type II toxin-antitoxin system VapC family toxin [Accumulibacter sp.]MCM8613200.1 type II toxin-antitoxin system VapC family toxin [Accumulibacter sp.]MCM8636513.1 type II toxin-antitoxin system VapC family toxin [Accumulibacter sp.]MCM8640253.1 type II toxin-antitoxin system VapC family toxin [Accumulibacter sp.]
MIYADTSVWVALLTPETGTDRVERWFEDLAGTPVSADWTLTEFHSAIALKTRAGQLLRRQASDVLALFERLAAGGLTLVPVSRVAYRSAAVLVNDFEQGLRGADALHIAVAQDLGVRRFATLDRRQGASAQRLGLTLELGLAQDV